ncbi:MAG: methyltransferase [Micavibrio aeruginosavorus]|uniref:Methyltransferase n=1 Tax=Micavibrio aeruginosavorus TaxID=349221 RepID=A0A7T5R3Z4_9BACT|nr:MAG: methyltransferase [Micavibrio aeruginosavorus]
MDQPEEIFVLNKRVRLLQPPKGFRTSLDSVMLAAACPAKAGDHILDMGAGVGGATFCLFRRTGCAVTGVEIQPEYADLALQNIALNQADGKVTFIQSDIRQYKTGSAFDHVICNPPYFETGGYTVSPDALRAQALGHQDEAMSVKDWIDAGFKNLRSGGSLTMIHQAGMTDDIVQALGRRFGAIEIIPLWPRQGEAAKRVIIRARKDRQTPCTLHPGLVLHQDHDGYTPETDGILRDMLPLT